METRTVAVELKNTQSMMKKGFHQLLTYKDYAHQVYLACTPELAFNYLMSNARAPSVNHWDSDLLTRQLNDTKCGLLLVEGWDVFEIQRAPLLAPSKMTDILPRLTDKLRVGRDKAAGKYVLVVDDDED